MDFVHDTQKETLQYNFIQANDSIWVCLFGSALVAHSSGFPDLDQLPSLTEADTKFPVMPSIFYWDMLLLSGNI
jgi:hypothetical protein